MKRSVTILGLAVAMGACLAWPLNSLAEAPGEKAKTEAKKPAEIKRPNVDFRLASDVEKVGYRLATYSGDKKLYLAPEIRFSARDLVDVEAKLADGGAIIELTFKPGNKKMNLPGATPTSPVSLGIELGGKLISTCTCKPGDKPNALWLGGMLPGEASGMARLLGGRTFAPEDATIFLIPKATKVRPGQAVSIDVYVSGIYQVRGFQVAVEPTGGQGGMLKLIECVVDETRPDYIFQSQRTVSTAADYQMMAAMFSGATDAESPAYLGSYHYVASQDAKGTFKIGFSPDQHDEPLTMFQDDAIQLIPCNMGPAVDITVVPDTTKPAPAKDTKEDKAKAATKKS